MRYRVLSVLPNSDQLERVQDALERKLKNISFDFKVATNEASAMEKLKDPNYDLVVSSLDIPTDSKALSGEGLSRGLNLAQWMEDRNMNIPTILFTVVDDVKIQEKVNKLKKCELVNEKLGWEDLFIKRVRQNLSPSIPKQDDQKRLDVDFRLDPDRKLVEYSFKGVVNIENKPLPVSSKEFLDLTKESRELERNRVEWERRLQSIGERLMDHIFFQDKEFYGLFWESVNEAGGLGNTRIRFVVEKEVYPIALEAIYARRHKDLKRDYWMLHAPIYRTLGEVGGWGKPLFHDRETRESPLNILIIESPTEGEVKIRRKGTEGEGWPHSLERLTNVIDECEFLKNYPSSRKESGRVQIGRIELIPRSDDVRPFVDQVQETLKGKWHIVHYAGHSYFDLDTGDGYVFFPSGQDEKGKPVIKVVELEELSIWLRPAEPNLVFLSSCHSSEEGFVFALAERHIPAIVGFRWDVEDEMAAKYTRVFYKELFEGETQSLEYVFLKARQRIHEQYRDNPIWAAPVLVMQSPAR